MARLSLVTSGASGISTIFLSPTMSLFFSQSAQKNNNSGYRSNSNNRNKSQKLY